jgi:hypothetical protein
MKLFARPSSDDEAKAASQARVDAIVASARARAQAPVPTPIRPLYREPVSKPLALSEDVLDNRLSEELAFARRTLEVMGETLCEDPILLSRHQVTLQSVDLLSQIIGHIASVVGAADREEAVTRIGMVELRNRLNRDRIVHDGSRIRRKSNTLSAH